MPLVFRKIKKSKWYKNDAVPWLGPDDLQADAIGDLRTKGNVLSVYFVEDDNEKSLERLITALAVNRQGKSIEEFEYALFGEDILTEIGIKITREEGDTADSLVNTWHRNLIELTTEKIVRLANGIRMHGKKQRVLGKRIRGMIIEAMIANRIARDKMKLSVETIGELEAGAALMEDNPSRRS